MYYSYFGLGQPPFKITPDTSLFFPGGNRGAVLDALIYAITSGEGIVKVVGEVGSGKTMLCRMLEVELPDNIEIVYLANPSLSPDNILHAIAFELKLRVKADDDRLKVMNKLQTYLVKKHAKNCQVVVFVEEAQSMPIATLEEIRLLSNLETQQYKLLQIVLFGQPELDQMIANREIRQLKERITYSFKLNPFKADDIRDYLNSRLRICGCRSDDLFSPSAIREITHYSNGLLRRINILADKAMLAAYASNTNKVKRKHVGIAARDSEFIGGWQRYRPGTIMAMIVMIIFAAFWFVPTSNITNILHTLSQASLVEVPVQTGHKKSELLITKEIDTPGVDTQYLAEDKTHYFEYFSSGELYQDQQVLDDELFAQDTAQSTFWGDNGSVVLELDEEIDDETLLLKQQLKLLPPEVVMEGEQGDTCKLCTSIIYRPLIGLENL